MNKYVGHSSQVCGIREFRMKKGYGKGMTFLCLYNGQGLELTLSADRCMDIFRLQFGGCNMGYLAPCGAMPPTAYSDRGMGFVSTYSGGFLTTCGLSHMGPPDQESPLHGRISNIPCDRFSYIETETALAAEAWAREVSVFGEQLSLHRRIILLKDENTFRVTDTVQNIGSKPTPCGVLYNYNLGVPFLSRAAELTFPEGEQLTLFPLPEGGEELHFKKLEGENASCVVNNADLGIRATLSFNPEQLEYLACYRQGARVTALEPANMPSLTRGKARQEGVLKELLPTESVTYETTWNFQKERGK